ncbi:diguanylate cyclase [Pararhodospirillum oryzae]|uniref:diguanylate cyclase n=1 Tax=Pararhodospirillum oryzae TaxID=478448 RepID=A0A512HC71_9PROT|nr:diguanylate cyclase [Pararhodospirillum oryzae]GEO83048.1 hypothetical protein ROR02_31790 [Pararhodospirillum oryzae]
MEFGQETFCFRKTTLQYILALALLAALAITSHIAIAKLVTQQADTARVVNIAGRQRMLSQRIAMLAFDLARTREPARIAPREAALATSLSDMESAFKALTEGSALLGISAAKSPAEAFVYAQEHLGERMNAFLGAGWAYLALPPDQRPDSPALTRLVDTAQGPLLGALEAVVAQRQADSEAQVSRLTGLLKGTLAGMLVTLVAEALIIFRPLFRRLKAAQDLLLDAALTDPLTGSKNRRFFMDTGTHEVARSRRAGRPLAVAILDIDRFKKINDTWGHAVGDEAIRTLVRTTLAATRESDVLGRLGGEEFGLLLPETNAQAARMVAEKIRAQVAATLVQAPGASFAMTVSIGVTTLAVSDDSLAAALDRADRALYRAKESGRNQVVTDDPQRESHAA